MNKNRENKSPNVTSDSDIKDHVGIEANYLSQLEIKNIPFGILILHGPNYVISFVNPVVLAIWGRKKEEVINKPLHIALPELKGQGFKKLLDRVYKSGIPFFGNNVPARLIKNRKPETVYFDFVYNPIRDENKKITGVFVTAIDTTNQVLANTEAEINRKRLYDLFMQAPAMIAITRGPNLVFELANPIYLKVVGKTKDIIGKGVFEVFPEIKGQPIEKILYDVAKKGKPFIGNEIKIQLDTNNDGKLEDHYFNFVYQPTYDINGKPDGVMTHAVEISDLVNARKKAEEEEIRFKTLIEKSTDAIQLVSPEGKILYSSYSIKNVLGYTPEELSGQGVAPYLHPDDILYFNKQLQKLLKKPLSQITLEYRVKHKDGSWAWLETIGVNHLNTPNINALVGTFRNITNRKVIEARDKFLAEVSNLLGKTINYEETLKSLWKLIVPYMADYCRIVVLDENKKIKEIAVNHLHQNKIQLVKDLYEEYKENTTTSGVGHILMTGKSEIMSKLTQDNLKNASPAILKIIKKLNLQSYMGVPMKIGSNVIGVITFSSTNVDRIYTKEDLAVAEELANRAALAIENARLYSEAQKAIKLRDEFISVASHELKTPVTSLKLYEQVISQTLSKEGHTELLRYIHKMDDQINKLNILIGDLLDISKIVNGKLEFNFDKFDLNETILEAVDTLQPSSKNHKLIIEGKIKKRVYGDKYRIYQVITNLLTNAIKYSPNADKVIIKLVTEKNFAEVTVKDFGIGIEKQHFQHLFEQFYRVSSTKEKTFPGLGMGLYIVKQIIDRHHGQMNVVSNKGKGSEFSFKIPLDKK
ncbi:MAG TPA: PAS domain S-box protein [Candidatus Nitrosocosmicus sp.]|nr:PAS domain S-box protein [Candidatus Nitrosocosmicus sp.]